MLGRVILARVILARVVLARIILDLGSILDLIRTSLS
jgi:hypothetical protein